MSNFNLSRLRDYIPKDLPSVQLPRMPSWAQNHESMNPDTDQEGPSADSHPLESPTPTRNPNDLVLEEPKPIPFGPKSYLDLVNECDNFPYYQTDPNAFFARINSYYGLYVKDHPKVELGYILPSVAEVFRGLPDWKIDDEDRSLTLQTGSTEEERTRAVSFATHAMRETDHFKVLRGWRDELYPVYGPKGELLLSMERAASALFGIVTYGCHMTAYTMKTKEGGEEGEKEMHLWVPRRAASKQTYGGMLDNTVAGGISTGESAFESLVREAQEEASLPEDVVRKGAKAVGTVTYFHIRDQRAGGETRLLQPECQYVYDLELDAETVPKPSDDEVEGFELKTIYETKQALKDGEFKPNCALVLLDFFIRHGIITADDEGFIEIVARLHRRLEFPMP